MVALHVAPTRKAPMEARSSVLVEAGRGIVGDRWHGSRHRHVTVQAVSDMEAAARELGRPVSAVETRRNVVVDLGPVPVVPGECLRIGDVVLEVVRLAAPCRVMDQTLGPGGKKALHARGGTVLRALTSGEIVLGAEVVPEEVQRVLEVQVPHGMQTNRHFPRRAARGE